MREELERSGAHKPDEVTSENIPAVGRENQNTQEQKIQQN
jgi:hypothetical protein